MKEADRSGVSRWFVGAAVVGFAAVSVITSAPGAFARSAIGRLPRHPTPMTVTLPHPGLAAPAIGTASTGQLKTWHSTIMSGATTYPYTMVGKNVTKAQTNPSTTVTAPVIPLIIKIGTHTWNPTVARSACGETKPVVSRVQKSPLFDTTHDFVFGGTDVGTTQYTDAFQRGNFYNFTNPTTGVNPGYHVLLKYVSHPAITITVPNADAGTGSGKCETEGAIEINWFDNHLQNTVFPALAAEGTPIGPNKFPIFVMRNVTFFINNVGSCCALGYHNAFNNPDFAGNTQTYTAFEWPDNSFFPASFKDTVVGSHEVAEWMDDPYTNNPTPAWGNIGQVTGCQSDLEVGDPLTPTNVAPVTVNGYTYHLQELAFFSWFFRQPTSWGVNGWYSNNGTFTAGSDPCP